MQLMQEKIQNLVQKGNRVEKNELKARKEFSQDRQKLAHEIESAKNEFNKEK